MFLDIGIDYVVFFFVVVGESNYMVYFRKCENFIGYFC